MKWYFALNARSIANDEMYARCVEAAVLSALQRTNLEPRFIFDGDDCALTNWLRSMGVKVIFHRTSFYNAIVKCRPDDMGWQQIAQGAYLRLDIPRIDEESQFVLYTDCDVLFLRNPELSHIRPALFAVAPESVRGDREKMNSGVMVINVPGMRSVDREFRKFVIAGLADFPAFDQGALQQFFRGAYDHLPDTLNWKPYWGPNEDAEILHFHGPKPPHVKAIQSGARLPLASVLFELYSKDPPYYDQCVKLWEDFVQRSHRIVPATNAAGRARWKYTIATCARWETDNIVEWVLYHQSIGFNHFYIYCNDDDPVELYEKLLPFLSSPDPLVTFLYFPIQGQQSQMLLHFLRNFVDLSEWIMFLDVDEFLHLPCHQDIDMFVGSMRRDTNLIYFNWIFFGNSGFSEHQARGTLANYTRRSARPNVNTKTLTRTMNLDASVIDKARHQNFWHHWGDEIAKSWGAVNVLGEPMHDYYRDFPSYAEQFISADDRGRKLIETAIINHYAFRSEREFIRRFERGVGGEFSGQKAWKDIHDRGQIKEVLAPLNEIEDRGLQEYWTAYLGRCRETAIIPKAPGRNIAPGGRATQSSTSQWSRFKNTWEDAAGAVSGQVLNGYQCHTDLESDPWWQLDLGSTHAIAQIRIYNRCEHRDLARRARNLKIDVSVDGNAWNEVFRRCSETPFGGADGNPLIVIFAEPVHGVLVRITLLGRTYLHFDQVEVYEWPAN